MLATLLLLPGFPFKSSYGIRGDKKLSITLAT